MCRTWFPGMLPSPTSYATCSNLQPTHIGVTGTLGSWATSSSGEGPRGAEHPAS